MKKFSRWELMQTNTEGNMERELPKNAPRFGDGVDVNPYAPKQLRMPTVDTIEGEIREIIKKDPITPTCETYREQIAHLIRLLTYRELKAIGDELFKNISPIGDNTLVISEEKTSDITEIDWAQTLDDWAHMVKEETNVRTEEK